MKLFNMKIWLYLFDWTRSRLNHFLDSRVEVHQIFALFFLENWRHQMRLPDLYVKWNFSSVCGLSGTNTYPHLQHRMMTSLSRSPSSREGVKFGCTKQNQVGSSSSNFDKYWILVWFFTYNSTYLRSIIPKQQTWFMAKTEDCFSKIEMFQFEIFR